MPSNKQTVRAWFYPFTRPCLLVLTRQLKHVHFSIPSGIINFSTTRDCTESVPHCSWGTINFSTTRTVARESVPHCSWNNQCRAALSTPDRRHVPAHTSSVLFNQDRPFSVARLLHGYGSIRPWNHQTIPSADRKAAVDRSACHMPKHTRAAQAHQGPRTQARNTQRTQAREARKHASTYSMRVHASKT